MKITGAQQLIEKSSSAPAPVWLQWLVKVQTALQSTSDRFPFLYYGTDWLAFAHFVIAIAFVGALWDPVRNVWLYTFGMTACVLVVPYAMIFGAIRGIPVWWRLFDCLFGVFGFIPLWFCRRWVRQIEHGSPRNRAAHGF
ncbi:MAG TPA: hypothetical protein VKA67_04820 [Verrucomicrobiae bacterium]|nr:hypothetical protein [Verrucomicrobiae bacterium]